ncbi:MAG: hypothetical protein O3C60_20370, partial [Planctomycetota bacterium]|nr:hypothetical protein [Planctomycetota bacterium]
MSRSAKYLRYTLTLQAPAIVTTLSGDPSSSTTQPFIPGGALRGVLAGELLNKGVSADSNDFRRLILEGDVRFLHAYPTSGSVRSLPAPIPWRKVKGLAGTLAHDLTAYTGRVDPETEFDASDDGELSVDPVETWPTVSLMRVEFPFLEFSGSTTRGLKARTDTRSHQQRDRVKGRSWKTPHDDGSEEAHGALFAYEYLEPGQTFHGLIQVIADSETEAEAIIVKITEILNRRQIAVGRSRRAGYGGAATISIDSTEPHEALWGDVQQNDVPSDSLFRAYLLSACIVRDPFTGQLDPCALPGLLVKRFGGEAVVSVERTLWDFETIGGFNRKWQIEVPQALAVKAGSVLIVKAKQTIPAAAFRQIEHDGFGERRIEGFGRLVFLKRTESLKLSIATADPLCHPMQQPTTEPSELIRFLQRRLLTVAFSRSLDRQVRAIVGDLRNIRIPTGSLLGRLRIPLRNGDPAAGLQALQQWLDGRDSNSRTALKEEAQKKLRECLLANGMPLRDWLIQTA